jgi:hypothetical protein
MSCGFYYQFCRGVVTKSLRLQLLKSHSNKQILRKKISDK